MIARALSFNSTNVRNTIGFAWHRVALAVSSALAPERAVARAARLFATPPRYAHTPQEIELLRTARGFVAYVGLVRIAAWRFGDEGRPAVVLSHGWGGRGAQFRHFVAPLVEAGFQVVTYDAPSHGDSGPGGLGRRRSSLLELMQAIDTVIEAHGPAHAIVGHSLGAAASALAVLDGTTADRLVLVASPAVPVDFTRAFAKALGFRESTRQLLLRRMEALAGRPLSDLDVLRRATGRTDLPPALVLADRADKETDAGDSERIAEVWPEAELVMSDGLGHRRILRDPATIATVVTYL